MSHRARRGSRVSVPGTAVFHSGGAAQHGRPRPTAWRFDPTRRRRCYSLRLISIPAMWCPDTPAEAAGTRELPPVPICNRPTRRNTTNGELNYQLQRYPYGHMKAESMKPEVVGGDTRGVMGFFTPGKETESKEGIDAAGASYAHARPYEGLAAGTPYTLSQTTQRGTKFTH